MKLLTDRRPRAPAAALLQPRQESAALPARRNLGHKQICQALRAKTPLAVSIAMVLWPQIFPQTRWTRRFRLGHRPAAAIVQLPPQRRNPHSFASNHRFVQSLSRRQLEWLPAQKIHKKRGSLPPKPRVRTTGFPGGPPGRRPDSREHISDALSRKAFAATRATRGNHFAPAGSGHPCAKPVPALAHKLAGLICPLHRAAPSY
jgi:hypothetical protein